VAKISTNPVFLDLGSNIGLTIAHMKQIYPTSKIVGYEMNKENYILAKENTNAVMMFKL
jgi:tRNA1(Val) A37 N6-methylase TrmN6